jgi:diguanylate cyclase
VATLMPNDTDDTLLARAGRALYAAKERGRNRIAAA